MGSRNAKDRTKLAKSLNKKMKYKDYKKTKEFKIADIVELYDKTGFEIEITGETRRRELNNKAVLDRKRRTEKGLTIDTVVLDVKEKK